MRRLIRVHSVKARRTEFIGNLHNFDHLSLSASVSVGALHKACMNDIEREGRKYSVAQLPVTREDRDARVLATLRSSTRGLSKDRVSNIAASEVKRLINQMQPGSEPAHPASLYNLLDMRGSDVRLATENVVEGGRRVVPYPAIAWEWGCVQIYAWRAPQHINILISSESPDRGLRRYGIERQYKGAHDKKRKK